MQDNTDCQGAGGLRLALFCFTERVNMWLYRLRLTSGEDLYYDNLEEARYDKMQFGGTIFDRKGKEVD